MFHSISFPSNLVSLQCSVYFIPLAPKNMPFDQCERALQTLQSVSQNLNRICWAICSSKTRFTIASQSTISVFWMKEANRIVSRRVDSANKELIGKRKQQRKNSERMGRQKWEKKNEIEGKRMKNPTAKNRSTISKWAYQGLYERRHFDINAIETVKLWFEFEINMKCNSSKTQMLLILVPICSVWVS